MRTLRTGASRGGYGGCKHASNYRNRTMGASRHQNYRYRRCNRSGFVANIIRTIILLLMSGAIATISIYVLAAETKDKFVTTNVISLESRTYDMPSINTGAMSGIIPVIEISATAEIPVTNVIDISTSSTEPIIDTVDDTPPMELDDEATVSLNLGSNMINLNTSTLTRFDLPDVYYPGIDFSSFQPYMDYRCITNKNSPAYKISHSNQSYTDDLGMRRFVTTENQFTINNQDDYVIALGTFYKEKGTAGSRYLIVTSTGMYTAITGDEKSDAHTDSRHMFSLHQDGSCAGIIEWIVDQKKLESTMKRAGTITAGPIEALKGEILYIYGIQ